MTDHQIEDVARQLICVGNRAMAMERYILRRAWGIYYAIWALAILLFIYIPNILNPIRQPIFQDVAFGISYGIIIAAASYFSGFVFSRAAMASKLQKSLSRVRSKSLKDGVLKYALLAALILMVVLLATGIFKTFDGVLFEAVTLGLVAIFVYRFVSQSMGRVPFEAIIAIGMFVLSDVVGTISVIITRGGTYYAYAWIPTVAVWLLASVLSFVNAGDELLQNLNAEECS